MELTTRQKILQAGLKLFSERGYLGATTKEIAAQAGIAEVTLFRYFPSKEKLFEEVINTYSFLPRLKELITEISERDYRESLILIAKRFLEVLNTRRDLIRIMHSEMQRYPDKIKKIHENLVEETLKTLSSYFEGLQNQGILKRFVPLYGARAFLGMFFSYFYAQQIKGLKTFQEQDEEKTITTYVDIFVSGTLIGDRRGGNK